MDVSHCSKKIFMRLKEGSYNTIVVKCGTEEGLVIKEACDDLANRKQGKRNVALLTENRDTCSQNGIF